jgi:hypothetical protein
MERLRKHIHRFRCLDNENLDEAPSVNFGTHHCPFLSRRILWMRREADLGQFELSDGGRQPFGQFSHIFDGHAG